MKNRTIPFGYQYENGVLAINPPEAHTVQKAVSYTHLERGWNGTYGNKEKLHKSKIHLCDSAA